MDAMAADVLAFIADQDLEHPIVFGHSMGGRVTLNTTLARPTSPRAIVLVDVGPELSQQGTKVVADFVVHNVEFDDLDVFLDNVASTTPSGTREHIARTVKYNLLQRADGKYVSKVDHRRHRAGAIATLDARRREGHHRARSCCCAAASREVLLADAAERFVDALPQGRLVTVPNVGHNVHGGNTPGFLEAVNPFLASLA